MKIFVIVLTFNSEQYLPDLLESLQHTEWPQGEHEVIFVDNGSNDNTLRVLREFSIPNFQFSIIENGSNLGFAKGNNIGMRAALDNGADYVVLLNDDTVVTPLWIEEMLAVFTSHSDAAEVQSLLLYWDDKSVVNTWGNHVHFLGFGFAGGNLEDKGQGTRDKGNVKEITYASGAAVMFRGDVLRKVGLFDEVLETYHEDLDIALRFRLAGYRSYCALDSVVYHKYQFLKSHETLSGKYKYYLMERNRLYLLLKYYSVRTLFLLFPAWLFMEGGLFLFAIVRGFWREKLRGYKSIYDLRLTIYDIRKKIRANGKVKDNELTHDFVGEIDYQEIDNPLLRYVGNPVMFVYWAVVRRLL